MLSACCGLLRIAGDAVVPAGTTTISGNAAGCNGKTEITNICSAALTIDDPADVPSNLATLVRIQGDLTIEGAIGTFPDFAALEVVEGDLLIDEITTAGLNNLDGIFPVLTEVQGSIIITGHSVVQTVSGFAALRSIGGDLRIAGNFFLMSVSGFGVITSIGGDLTLSFNSAFVLRLASLCQWHGTPRNKPTDVSYWFRSSLRRRMSVRCRHPELPSPPLCERKSCHQYRWGCAGRCDDPYAYYR